MKCFIVCTLAFLTIYVAADDTSLQEKIKDLQNEIQKQIHEYTTTNHKELTSNLVKFSKEADELARKANATTDKKELDKVAASFLILKRKVNDEKNALKKDAATVDELQRDVAILKAQINVDIKLLQQYNLTTQIEILRIGEKRLDLLLKDMKNGTDVDAVRYIETTLRGLKSDIEKDLKQAEDDLKNVHKFHSVMVFDDNVAQKVQELSNNIKAEIHKLESEGHKKLTSNLVKINKKVDDLAHKVNSTTDSKKLHDLLTDYIKLNREFSDEVNALKKDTPAVDVLAARAKSLLFQIKTDIELLNSRNLTGQAAILQVDADRLELLVQSFDNETDVGAIRHLEIILRGIEQDISKKLTKIEDDLMKPEKIVRARGDRDLFKQSKILLGRN